MKACLSGLRLVLSAHANLNQPDGFGMDVDMGFANFENLNEIEHHSATGSQNKTPDSRKRVSRYAFCVAVT